MRHAFTILLVVALLSPLVDPIRGSMPNTTQAADYDDGALYGNSLPETGQLCKTANVYGNAHGIGEPFYALPAGAMVGLREWFGEWVMIGPARWVNMSALCPFEGD